MSGDTSTSEASLKTRSGAGTSTSTASAKRRKAQVSQLKALQARRAADEAERALESRRRAATAAAAAAEAEAQLVIQEARAEAQRAADAAEIDALELRLMEDDDLKSQSPNDLVFEDRDREGNGAPADPRPPSGVISRHGQMQQLTDVNQIRSQSAAEPQRAHLHEQNANADARERTERWLSELPCGDGQRRTSSLPKITLDEFDGSPLEWPRWSGLFRALVHDNGALSDTKRLTYLQSCLTGEAREAVRGLLCDGNMYEEALKELDMQFGDPRAVVTATLDGVLKHHSIKENDVESLMRFSRALHAAVSVLSARGFEADLAAVTNLDQVLEKLPRSLAWQWGQVELKMAPRRPTLGDVDQWLRPLVLAGRRALSVSRQREVMMPRTQRVAPAEPAGRRRGSSQRTTLATATATEPAPCPACDGEAHNLDCCPVFKAMAPVDRLQLARDNRRCYRCLGESHWASRCRKKLICGENGCRGKHHPLLHVPDHSSRRSEEQDAPALAADQPRSVMATALDATSGPRKALLQVVPVRVLGPAGKFVDTHALLDSGADTSLCIESVLRDLSVTGSTEKLTLGNVEGTGMTRPTMKVSLQVAPLSADGQCEPVKVPEVFSVPQLNIRPQRVDWSKRAQWKHLEGISIPDTNGRKIELLLGANVLEAILQREARVGGPGQPAAIRTYFGWCLTGSVAQLLPVGSREVLHVAHRCEGEEKLQALVRDFWSTEAFGTRYNMKQPRSHEDRLAEEMMESTTKWRGDRYETGLLWKPDCAPLPNDRSMALRRLESTEKALRRAPEKAAAYRDTMREYLDKGYARLLTEEELQKHHQRCWYLPHHAVTSASKPGKFRVVFDAAAKFAGTSLNENLLTGPDLLKQIPGVLLRFRQQPVALIADIEQMFLQVAVREEDQPALRFLWRDLETDRPPSTYQMDRVIFGARSSPASASFVLKKTAEERAEDTPEGRKAAAIVVEDFYMDDMVTSVNSPAQAKTIVIEVTKLISRGGFRLRKWLSNDKSVLVGIPVQERAPSTADLEKTLPTEKVLGVTWDAEQDELSSTAPSELANVRQPATKREILRVVASIFDPLGFTSPFVLLAKLQLQALWSCQQGWDDPLTTEESDRWAAWMEELPRLSDTKLPRWYGVQEEAPLRRDLHVFCDGSEKAFGAVAYLRHEYSDRPVLDQMAEGICPQPDLSPQVDKRHAELGARRPGFDRRR
ncbi:uncharacterized protein LOC122369009 isoform X1 [Amphibalanus amphitrite]|uniref:uncharacterized protein LOC122369009 isoform X1 n=1 Tax=Amphibalanus amphitrite TaxID=1232801 RepID=UPI001C92AE4A|nr:uncharacterized protein LOC122369009 isoform X1 [Amphibalanus amphitrite]